MTKTTKIVSGIFLVAGLLMTENAFTNSGGVPGVNLSGSPASAGTCANCHTGGNITTQDVVITTDIPASGFEENTDYNITIKGIGNGGTAVKGGLSATVENTGGFAGNVNSVSGGGANVSGNIVTHTGSNNTFNGDSLVYKFKWNSGNATEATIYTAVNFANGNGNTGGDAVKTASTLLTKSSIGIEELQIADLKLYPNPVADVVTLNMNLSETANLRVSILDYTGRTVMELTNGIQAAGKYDLTTDISAIANGNYILAIDYLGKQYNQKLVKL